jgi:hypothetical protein
VGLAHVAKGIGAEREFELGKISRNRLRRGRGDRGVVVGGELREKCVELRLIVDRSKSLGRKFGRNNSAVAINAAITLVMCFTSIGIDVKVIWAEGGWGSSPLDCVLGRHRGCRFGCVSDFSSLFIRFFL